MKLSALRLWYYRGRVNRYFGATYPVLTLSVGKPTELHHFVTNIYRHPITHFVPSFVIRHEWEAWAWIWQHRQSFLRTRKIWS